MSSFLSNPAPAFTSRRRLASQPQLFPVGPQPLEPTCMAQNKWLIVALPRLRLVPVNLRLK